MKIVPNVTPGKFPCVHCGSEDANIIREGADPRLKCNRCNGMFNGSEATAAKKAGALPDPNNPPAPQPPRLIDDPAANPRDATRNHREPVEESEPEVGPANPCAEIKVPRRPDFVFITRDRRDPQFEYVTQKDLKKTVLKWESRETNYDIYSLTPKKAQVKVDFNET